ncbi:DsrE family protein [Roseomonas sp. SSH11]|uniref:DsrE family protein n=1 Tax=Pararoseomonas baculiformis TaxID=2820812 RepID=A0ABS4ABH0_9PROT|nr:DsrE family protein [Pararoseomonas baculiformis]MBP0444351.1 DsrE family protein [Pararoseomonas baculiformis]
MTPLGILLRGAGHEPAHYALVLATGAAAIGRPVTLFATNAGLALFRRDAPLLSDPREARLEASGVAGVATLWEAAVELGLRRIACEAGMRSEGIAAEALSEGIELAGVVTFLEATRDGQLLSL